MTSSSNSQWETSRLKTFFSGFGLYLCSKTKTQHAVANDWVHQMWNSTLSQSNLVSHIFHHIRWIVELFTAGHRVRWNMLNVIIYNSTSVLELFSNTQFEPILIDFFRIVQRVFLLVLDSLNFWFLFFCFFFWFLIWFICLEFFV